MLKYFTSGINLFGAFIWFFNYYQYDTNICMYIAILHLFLVAHVLTQGGNFGKLKK